MLFSLSSLACLLLAANAVNGNIIIPAKKRYGELSGKFIHVTDFHLDPYYVEGTDVAHFCHTSKGDTKKGVAGRFGTLGSKCDSPTALVEAAFDFMSAQAPDADFVIYTGDSVRHDRDKKLKRTKAQVLEIQRTIVNYFQKSFDKVIPVLGNNDVMKHNHIQDYDQQYNEFKATWEPYNLALGDDFEQGGFYVQEIIPKLRTINTNTLSFTKKNKLISDCDVPGSPGRNQLDWLKKSLDDTRADGSKAYILAHIPPNSKKDKHFFRDKCYNEYYSILGSYSDVIVGHFSGHFNYDQLTAVLQNKEDGTYTRVAALGAEEVPMTAEELEIYKVVGVLFNAPSIIPEHNPAIRIYTYETEGYRYPVGTILDWDQYYANLEEANQSGNLEFKLEYKASTLYNVDHFDASGLQTVFEAISLNEEIRQQYSNIRKVIGNEEAAYL
ncbi:Metallo-dependent phosphatase-like protein [Mucor mucedo]|uniref:Metallo-dependent phosphatase-like protein n=1 Tax=Mucor mucedo TaxID=29922 RepID=UPI002220C04C|nr:Metallo-dependent phosphatase-like protein [Mucor mucedo]KAI7893528.1 Metallo-dependent phosphatase-like protein [Mucor mucedo]